MPGANWLNRRVRTGSLSQVATRDEFEALLEREKPSEFLEMRSCRERALRQNRTLLQHIGFDPKGRRCLDIGPGHGESLDVWHEMGAAECAFAEGNRWCVQHNQLKGFARGVELDHLLFIQRLPKRSFDFIWIYGSISCDKKYFKLLGKYGFVNWVHRVESLVAPGGTVVACPFWLCQGRQRVVAQPSEHWMGRAFRELGYEQLPFIDGHNIEPMYPITWIKR
jgi:hypothetical protein